MKKTWKLSLFLAAPFLLAGCGGKDFKEFTSREWGFKVLMPGKPKDKKQVSPFGKMTMFGYQETDGAYAVACLNLASDPGQLDADLDEAVKGMAANVRGKVTSQTKLTNLDRGAGRDVRMELPGDDRLLHARVLLVNGRLYEVTALGKKDWVESDDTAKFLDSFAVLREKKKTSAQ